jgi:hypothetical protein
VGGSTTNTDQYAPSWWSPTIDAHQPGARGGGRCLADLVGSPVGQRAVRVLGFAFGFPMLNEIQPHKDLSRDDAKLVLEVLAELMTDRPGPDDGHLPGTATDQR